MATRVATLDYRVTGAETSTARVRGLNQALNEQRRNALAATPAMAAAQRGTGMLGAVSAASTGRIMALTGALGPLGAGLGHIAARAPLAAGGIMQVAAASERMGLLSRASNAALLGGAAVMAVGAVTAVGYASAILRGADAYTSMTSRLRIFSDGLVAAANNERELFERAREARAGVEGLNTLFVRISPAVEDMGRAQGDALEVVEATSKALSIQGATAQEAWASTVQFSQALASGVLRGDELRSMMESSPLLMRYLAQNLEMNGRIGVSFGQIRSLGHEGLLTSEKLIDALMRARPQIEADFINAPKTAQQGWTMLRDTIQRTVGQLATTSGLQQGVFAFLGGLTDRLDAFRERMILNPDAFDPVIEAGQLFGDVLDTAGRLAGGVAEHFDLITEAARVLIALKLGEVLATGFGAAVIKAREAFTAIQTFRANGPFLAGAALDETGAAAAVNARTAAMQAQTRATELQIQADLRARTATAARAASDAAAADAARLKASAGVQATVVAQAEARASALNAAAERAETASRNASTAAKNAGTAASTRLAIAEQAELAVTRQVTNAQALKAAVGRGLSSLYMLMGGHIGAVTLALGGLIYAVWSSKRAWDEKIEALRDAVVISDDLERISRAVASANWAEVPALLAAAEALREKARAAREAAQAQRDELDSRTGEIREMVRTGRHGPNGWVPQAQREARRRELDEVLEEARRDEFREREATRQTQLRALTVEGRERSEENRTGRDAAGREISADRRADNERRLGEIRAQGMRHVSTLDRMIAQQQEAIDAASGAQQRELQLGVGIHRESWQAAAELATVGQPNERVATPPAGGGGGGGASRRSSTERAPATTLERISDAALIEQLMGRTARPSDRFSVRDGTLFDGAGAFTARSEDEARAASAYLEQIEAITTAQDALIAETGMTREGLAAQAAQMLETALATSSATQAEQRWAQQLAEARGESNATAEAEREVTEARRQGATITEEAAAAYVALATAQERARRAEAALNEVRPVVAEVTRAELDRMGALPERWRNDVGGMGFDPDAAMAEWAAARERIAAESERRIRAELERQVTEGLISREAADRQAIERIAAMRVAVEVENAQQIADIWRTAREDDERAWRERLEERLEQERQLADAFSGSLEDLVMGGDPSDIGRRFAEDLLRSIWQELVGNPLNLAIRNALRAIASPDDNGGLWGAIFSAVGGAFGGGGSGPSPDLTGLYSTGGLPGSERGRVLPAGLVMGAGGSREDRIRARVSPFEFIVNAAATRRHLPLLTALNAGAPGFADGGLPGSGVHARLLADAAMRRDEPFYAATVDSSRARSEQVSQVRSLGGLQIDNSRHINAPGADPAALRRVQDQLDALQDALPTMLAEAVPAIMKAMRR